MTAEFDHFRFLRDQQGSLAELAGDSNGERIFLVLDCRRHRLAQLHIFEGLAESDDGVSERFERDLKRLREIRHPGLTPILGHGRDDSELYYALAISGGESLESYLRRVGPLPESLATDLTLDLLGILTSQPETLRCLEHFDFGKLRVSAKIPNGSGLRLKFAEYGGWRQPSALNHAEVVTRVALGLYSLLSGTVFRRLPRSLFDREAGKTSDPLRILLEKTLPGNSGEHPFESLQSFAAALRSQRDTLGEATGWMPDLAPAGCQVRDWLLAGQNMIEPGPSYHVTGPSHPEDFSHAFEATKTRAGSLKRLRFQLFPECGILPRDGWPEQHQAALRRPGHGLPNQLAILAVEEWGRCQLIAEERVDGVSIQSLLRSHGPLGLNSAREIIAKVNAALECIEKTTGAAPVWLLGTRDVFLVLGDTPAVPLLEAAHRNGSHVWHRFPVRLRLHLTVPDLIEGTDLPDSLVERLNAGGKAGERVRRAAVLLPLIHEMLTGIRLAWDQPITALPEFPDDAVALLENTRIHLITEPGKIQSWLLDDLNRRLSPGVNPSRNEVPLTKAAELIAPLGEVPGDDATLEASSAENSDQGSALFPTEGRTHLALSLKPFSRHRAPNKGFPMESLFPTMIEASGEAEESAFFATAAGAAEASATISADTEVSVTPPIALPTWSAGLSSRFCQLASTFTAGSRLRTGFHQLRSTWKHKEAPSAPEDPGEDTTPNPLQVTKCLETPEPKLSHFEAPEDAASGEVTMELPLLFLENDSHPSTDDREQLSFFAFLKSGTEETNQGEPESGLAETVAFGTPLADDGPPSIGSLLQTTSLLEGLGITPVEPPAPTSGLSEPDSAVPAEMAERSRSDSAGSLMLVGRVAGYSIAAVVAVWALIHGLVTVAGSVERETLADSLESVIHTDYLKLASQSPQGIPAVPEREATRHDETHSKTVRQIDEAAEAIRQGNEARSVNRTSEAVNLYLRALELDPASTEARSQLWSALDLWTATREAPIAVKGDSTELETAAGSPPPAADWVLADYHLQRRDPALGFLWLRRSAEGGHPRHQRLLGLALSAVPENLPEAIGWYRKAAESGDTEAQFLLGAALLSGRGVPVDQKGGADWIEKAALTGDGRALDLLGVCNAEGWGREADQARALALFQQACDAGNPLAFYNLATRYAKGLGTPRDKVRAASLYLSGAALEDTHCMHALGRCFEAGFGVPRDQAAATDWMRKAAARGHHEALAWCLRQGIVMEVATR